MVVLEKLHCKIRLQIFLGCCNMLFGTLLCAVLQNQHAISQQYQKFCHPSEKAPVED